MKVHTEHKQVFAQRFATQTVTEVHTLIRTVIS